ncbi:MAG: Ferredoxin-dependent glutamate synthase (EC [uncultured Sulfurovum sp.]|uniref:Ferredoxin-dependent glutamate synthase (EC) n=1 Tax=uncultured Sulfurovum sp. TaxID=269237 RepID=A0A6S6T728_9BACT|nr:MAG: Ferredoxin-dependent glutamate synthase (EC [uncultured Sulfurovum sp.]
MEELLKFTKQVLTIEWTLFFKIIAIVLLIVMLGMFIYDRFVQRNNQLLINFPLIGRMRYFFHLLRDPMRQYFGDETYYDSFEKIDWINKAAAKKSMLYYSFSMEKPYNEERVLFRHANTVLNNEEVNQTLSLTFGENRPYPFVTKSIIGRSAMSDGAISPEGTQAFAQGAYLGQFPINTGEGGLTSNFLSSHQYSANSEKNRYFSKKEGTVFAKSIYVLTKFLLNKYIAKNLYRDMVVRAKDADSYIFDEKRKIFYRIDWSQPLEVFPKEVLEDIPDITFQMGSGLYGVKNKEGMLDADRYQKVMKFCKMTEIKMAQGAKQTGGKLLAEKVTESIAYYRGIEAHKSIISPNRFPYAHTITELFDFVETLQELSEKPVGIKIVISTLENFQEYSQEIKKRIDAGKSYPDFLTIDGGDGGSGTAPREMMTRIGLPIRMSLDIVMDELERAGIRDKIKIIASEKVLTPDDAVELFMYGADFVNIARGFMISAGCIRARHCSGAGGHHCPVGLATMDKAKRSKFLVARKSQTVANYHNALTDGIKSMLAIMGKKDVRELSKEDILEK